MPTFSLSDFLGYTLTQVSTHPLLGLALTVPLVLVAFRLFFLSGLTVTVTQERRAVQIERTKEHAARAAHLRLVARRMTDNEVA